MAGGQLNTGSTFIIPSIATYCMQPCVLYVVRCPCSQMVTCPIDPHPDRLMGSPLAYSWRPAVSDVQRRGSRSSPGHAHRLQRHYQDHYPFRPKCVTPAGSTNASPGSIAPPWTCHQMRSAVCRMRTVRLLAIMRDTAHNTGVSGRSPGKHLCPVSSKQDAL